jgi:hypothetical protein
MIIVNGRIVMENYFNNHTAQLTGIGLVQVKHQQVP